jgi:hypothetical protein
MVEGISNRRGQPMMPALAVRPPMMRPPVTGVAAVQATRSRDLSLSITTDQGDTVTLTMHAATDVLAASYRDRVRGHHGRGRGHGLDLASASTEQSMSLTVQGDLSPQELADIGRLMEQVGRAVKAFDRQDAGAASQALASFGDLGSLQSFTLGVSQRQQTSGVVVLSGGGGDAPGSDSPANPQVAGD